MAQAAAILLLSVIGACVGSFAATLGSRMARSEQALFGRSRCDACGVALTFAETVPLISFLWLRGACAACGHRIDRVQLIGEAAGAAILLASFAIAPIERAALLAAVGMVLIASAVADIKTQRLPDALTLLLAGLGLGLAVERSVGSALTGLAAAASTFVVLEIVRRVFVLARGRSGLGFGDVKLIAALAMWLGLATPAAVVVASTLTLLVLMVAPSRDGRIAFGPALAASAFIVGMVGEAAG